MMTIVEKHGEVSDTMVADANYILDLLALVYPGHPWGVRVMEGGFFIQYMLLPFDKPFGMACKYDEVNQSVGAMRHAIIMLAGEWLERSGMARGKLEPGAEIEWVEGVPDKYQMRPLVLAESVHVMPDDSEGTKLRESARPQK